MQIRPIRASDAKNYRSILARTSEQDRYCRFFHVVDHFDPEQIRHFVVPRAEMIGFIALENRRALGAVHACFLEPDSAELAIVVASDARQRGVGKALLTRLVAALRARGLRHLVAYALAENHAFAQLARTVGMQLEATEGSVATWTLPPATGYPRPAPDSRSLSGDAETESRNRPASGARWCEPNP